METYMSIQSRRELLATVKLKYRAAKGKEKSKILDGFIAATGYDRKYAIRLLKSSQVTLISKKLQGRKPTYTEDTRKALLFCYEASNNICPKRFIPFIGELVRVLKLHGHLTLSVDTEKQLLNMSSATAERILSSEKKKHCKGISTTKPGALLKKQIQVRTFSDWDDVTPGFMEIDLVAHCGGNTHGSFLNTFTLTDICTGWTEPMAILCKGSAHVISSLNIAQEILPFKLLGIDTDNGSEFINYDLLDYCKEKKITFTRSRTYRKNDQAHVEEKNGSIVRRMVGYDRFEGIEAWKALVDLYSVLRLYVNYFQPSMKLLSKARDGSHVTKKYDKAKTPCQRLLESKALLEKYKIKLQEEYKNLDPVKLLKHIRLYQDRFWTFAWCQDSIENDLKSTIPNTNDISEMNKESQKCNRNFRQTRKPMKGSRARDWRTRPDDFKDDWDRITEKLNANPNVIAKDILDELIKDKPEQYNAGQLRTLQRRVKEWKIEWLAKTKVDHLAEAPSQEVNNEYLSAVFGVVVEKNE